MTNDYKEKFNIHDVNRYDFCVGCGGCSYVSKKLDIKEQNGNLLNVINLDNINNYEEDKINKICPFTDYSKNEDDISNFFFKDQKDINISHDERVGYWLEMFSGHVTNENDRLQAGSGGITSWLAENLLDNGIVDAVIHSTQSNGDERIFNYGVSTKSADIRKSRGTKYYQSEFSEALQHCVDNNLKFVFIGVPCYVKTIRNLSLIDSKIRSLCVYTIGLVCGHLKSAGYTKLYADMMDKNSGDNTKLKLKDFKYRKPVKGLPSNSYAFEATYSNEHDKEFRNTELVKNLPLATDWGAGLFRLKACDFCDDIYGETADVSIGDCWLPENMHDYRGTNVVIVRNKELQKIFSEAKNENKIRFSPLSLNKVLDTQSGNITNRRTGLMFRIWLYSSQNKPHPVKRNFSKSKLVFNPKILEFAQRMIVSKKSHVIFESIRNKQNFSEIFFKEIRPYIAVLNYSKQTKASLRSKISRLKYKIKAKINLLKI